MKNKIFKSIAILIIAIGIYGIFSCILFYKNQIFSVSPGSSDKIYNSTVKPMILSRLKKLKLDHLEKTEKENIVKIVSSIAIDKNIVQEQLYKFHIVLLSLMFSLFAISLGISILLWRNIKQNPNKIASPNSDSAAAKPE